MVSLGAPICVSILRIFLLSGIIIANPSIVPFVELSLSSVLFWIVVVVTESVYLKASLADPGTLKTCPSKHLSVLEASVGVPLTRIRDLKVQDLPSPRSIGADTKGIGRIRIRGKSSSNKHAERRTYNRVVSEGVVNAQQRETYAFRQKRYHEEKKENAKKRFAIRRRMNDRQLLNSSSSEQSFVDESPDQKNWNERQKLRQESWSDLSQYNNDDTVIDFARDSYDEDSSMSNVLMISSADESSYNGDESDEDEIEEELQPQIVETGKDCKNNEIELISIGKNVQNLSTTTASSTSRLMSQPDNNKLLSTSITNHQADECEGLYLYSSEDLTKINHWRKTIDDLENQFNKKITRKHPSRNDLHVPCPHPFTFLKKSLGQVGIAVSHDTTASATVGVTLTYAIAASAAVPFAVVGVAATQIANTAIDVLGVDNKVSRACQNITRSARQLTTKLKHDEPDDDSLKQIYSNDESQGIQFAIDKKAIRSRPTTFISNTQSASNIQPSSTYTIEATQQSNELFKSDENNFSVPISSIAKSHLPLTLSPNLDPPVLRYCGVITRTPDGHPCQSKIQLRFCRVCEKYQPLRTKHCSDCSICVRTMDHHCPWLGTCVGENNRIWFFWFLIFQSTELTWGLVEVGIGFLGMRNALEKDISISTVILLNIYLVMVFMIMLFLVIMVFCLIGYHAFLAVSNLTTWENVAWGRITYLRNLPEKKGSPFSTGVSSNLSIYCCPPNIWSLIRSPFLKYTKVYYGPENEVIWEHGEQKTPCCGESSCCSDC